MAPFSLSSSLPAPKAQERWRNNKELHQVPLANCRSAILTLMKAMMIMTLPIIIDYDNGHGHASDVRYYLFSSPFSRQWIQLEGRPEHRGHTREEGWGRPEIFLKDIQEKKKVMKMMKMAVLKDDDYLCASHMIELSSLLCHSWWKFLQFSFWISYSGIRSVFCKTI